MNSWIVPTPDQNPEDAGELYKLAGSTMFVVFDFGNFDELYEEGAALTGTPTVDVNPVGLTVGPPSLLGEYRVQLLVSGGDPEQDYVLRCRATTLDGAILSGRGLLKVR